MVMNLIVELDKRYAIISSTDFIETEIIILLTDNNEIDIHLHTRKGLFMIFLL